MNSDSTYLIIGVDGGGTGCRVGIESAGGTRLGAGRGGAANVTTDPDGAARNVREAVGNALADAGLNGDALVRATAHVGLAGVLGDAQARVLAAALPFGQVVVSDDRVTSAAGALGPEDGVVAAVGTGSFVVRRHAGANRFFGGWGLRLGDQASGAWLGRALLERCLMAIDGLLPQSELTRAALDRFGGDPAAIVDFAVGALPRDYAGFAPSVIDAARADDRHGVALMRAGAGYLADCIGAEPLAAGDIVCLMGGVGPHYAPYLGADIRDRLRPERGSALDGALYLARDAHRKRERTG